MSIDTSLDDYLARIDTPVELLDRDLTDPEVLDRWPGIRSDAEANWALRHVATAETEIARIRAEAQATIDAVQAWAEQAERQHQRDVDFFTGALITWRHKLEQDRPDLPKTYKLAAGNLVRRAQPQRVVVVDQEAFTRWAAVHLPEALTVRPKVSEIPKAWPRVVDDDAGVGVVVDVNGEPVPGVQVVDQDDRYSVTTNDPTQGPF